MPSASSLADLPRQTIANWHRFVATGDQALLASLLAEDVVFRSPAVHAPIPGKPATLLVLTTVVQIFENFRYEREFASGSHDAGLEFAANVGKFELKGIDLIKFNTDGKMVDFDPPAEGLAGRRRGHGEPDRPAIDGAEIGGSGPLTVNFPR